MINYEGIFFYGKDLDIILSLEKEKLSCVNDFIHCTFKYKPKEDEIFDELVGKTFYIDLIGYGCDGFNSGFIVDVQDDIKKYYINTDDNNRIKRPHITCSVSFLEDANNTEFLNFEMFNNRIRVYGKFGYFIKDDNGKAYVSFDKFKK